MQLFHLIHLSQHFSNTCSSICISNCQSASCHHFYSQSDPDAVLQTAKPKKKNNPQTSDNPPHLFNRANYRKSLIELSCCQEKHAVNCSQHFLPFQAFWTLRNAMKFLFWSIPSKQYWVQKVYEEFLQSITFNATLIIKWFYKTRCFPD